MSFFSKFFAVMFLLLVCMPAQALEIQKTEADGQEIWYSSNSLNPIISIKIAFKNAGTANDPEGKMGLANFVTAMLNEGAGDIKSAEFLQALEDNSIMFSPSADVDNFYISIKTLSSNLDVTLKLLNLAISQPNFEQQDFDRVKEQILTGLRKKLESAGEVASDEFKSAYFGEYKYAKNADGTLETINNISPKDLHGFVAKNFAKSNFVIGIAGDVSEALAKEITAKVVGGLPRKAKLENVEKFSDYPAAKKIEVEKDFPQTVIIFAKQGLARDNNDFYAGYLLNQVFGGSGFQSRLYEEVREKRGLTYYAGSGMQNYAQADLIVGRVATQTSKKDESIEVIAAEIKKIGEQGVTAEELESARKYVVGSYPFSLDSSLAVASHIVSLQLDGLQIDYAKQRTEFFNSVTLEEVNALAKEWFAGDDWFFISVGQKTEK